MLEVIMFDYVRYFTVFIKTSTDELTLVLVLYLTLNFFIKLDTVFIQFSTMTNKKASLIEMLLMFAPYF